MELSYLLRRLFATVASTLLNNSLRKKISGSPLLNQSVVQVDYNSWIEGRGIEFSDSRDNVELVICVDQFEGSPFCLVSAFADFLEAFFSIPGLNDRLKSIFQNPGIEFCIYKLFHLVNPLSKRGDFQFWCVLRFRLAKLKLTPPAWRSRQD
jgi:hypothetical protein